MTKRRQTLYSAEELIPLNERTYVRYAEGAILYSMGEHNFAELAKEAGAVRKIKGVCLVNVKELNRYIEDMY